MKDPFAPTSALRLKPVDIRGFPAPIDLRRRGDDRATLTVGRADDNDVALTGGDFPSVSSHHARFELVEGALLVRDLGSKNGTLVNGATISDDTALTIGDQVRLGSVGPKFVVVGGRALDETVFVHKETIGSSKRDVETIVRKGARATMVRVGVLVSLLAAAVVWLVLESTQDRARLATQGQEYADELRSASVQIAALEAREQEREAEAVIDAATRAERIRALEKSLAERTTQLEATVAERSAEEKVLQERIEEMETRGASREALERFEMDLIAARADLDKTREELSAARRRVDLFDPVNLAQARLSGVGQVRRSVVLIESRVRIREITTGATLHIDGRGPTGEPNFEGRGDEFELESTGSGFCIDPDGWILTNAHVVVPPDSDLLRALSRSPLFEQFVELKAVFSSDSSRHPATVECLATGGVDLALLKIAPFTGMPTLRNFSTTVPPPPAGSDIYLFGFPLGHLAVQEGEKVIASTFRGILSRNVGGQMQVDAGVHPGNSGGPITDAQGRVVGIVVSVQALPDRTAVYTIGYGIPIADAAQLWPRPMKAAAVPVDGTPTEAAASSEDVGEAASSDPDRSDPDRSDPDRSDPDER